MTVITIDSLVITVLPLISTLERKVDLVQRRNVQLTMESQDDKEATVRREYQEEINCLIDSHNSKLDEKDRQIEEQDDALEVRFNLLCLAQELFTKVLGRENIEDSIDKFNAYRLLEDIKDEVG